MSDRTKILNFLIENGCEILHLEALESFRVLFKKGKARMSIVIDKIDFNHFKEEYEKVLASVQEPYKVSSSIVEKHRDGGSSIGDFK